jgi:hypothetical protein
MARARAKAAAEAASGHIRERIPGDVSRAIERAGYRLYRPHDWVYPEGWPQRGEPARCKRCNLSRSVEHAEQSCEPGEG